MKKSTKKLLFWTPRIVTILFAIFISLFALDVFEQGAGFWSILVALLMHLIPTFIIVIALVLAWRWEWIGAVLYLGLAVFYIVWTWGRFPFSTYVLMSGPLTLVAVLFLINWLKRAEIRST